VNARVHFGDFVLELEARELRRRDRPVPLSPKAFQLLEILVTSRPKAWAGCGCAAFHGMSDM